MPCPFAVGTVEFQAGTSAHVSLFVYHRQSLQGFPLSRFFFKVTARDKCQLSAVAKLQQQSLRDVEISQQQSTVRLQTWPLNTNSNFLTTAMRIISLPLKNCSITNHKFRHSRCVCNKLDWSVCTGLTNTTM